MKPMTSEQIAARYDDGYGRGHGSGYKPWLGIRDVPSLGVATEFEGWKTGRTHVVFSNLERAAVLAAQRLDRVIDIREQFPLWPMSETEAIADELGVNHPVHPKGGNILMTTDILLSVAGSEPRLEPITVKPESKLGDVRVLEKLEIERVYWERRGSSLEIVTGIELPDALVTNLNWMDEYHTITPESLSQAEIEVALDYLFDQLHAGTGRALRTVCSAADGRLGHPVGTCMSVVRHALSRRYWTVPLDRKLDPGQPFPLPARNAAVARPLIEAAAP